MHEKALYVFWITLTLYLITLFTVSYVGVYITYIAILLIIISCLIVLFTKKKIKLENSTTSEIRKASGFIINESRSLLSDFNKFVEKWNKKYELKEKRTSHLIKDIDKLKLEKNLHHITIKYSKSSSEIENLIQVINNIDKNILTLQQNVALIEKECELELARLDK